MRQTSDTLAVDEMPVTPTDRGPTNAFGRRRACAVLDRLVADVIAGSGRTLVLRGGSGVGKSALLDHLRAQTAGWSTTTAAGVASETDLAYGGLHQVCSPLLVRVATLPVPQRDALEIAFGLRAGPPPDRFLVGLAALTLIAAVTEERPLACVVDDAHWLDRTSAQVLAFVARRVRATRVAIVCATRSTRGDDILAGLPELQLPRPGRRAGRAPVALVRAGTTDVATLAPDETLRRAGVAAAARWDDAGWEALSRRQLDLAREAGTLPEALDARALTCAFMGDLAAAAALVGERRSLPRAAAGALPRQGEVGLLAVRGHAEDAEPLIHDCLTDDVARGDRVGVATAQWARAILGNGLGRYGGALAAANEAAADDVGFGAPQWALAELVEAGVRSGDARAAAAALERLSSLTRACGTDWALGTEASRRALLCDGAVADELHREAIERLARTRVRLELARARLRYGEWLRRRGHRIAARAQLRSAHQALSAMGADAFAARARRELLATGETVRPRTAGSAAELTAQEACIAGLVGEGLTNAEIGAALFLSPRTVEWHLGKIFTKLGVSTRRQLRPAVRGWPGCDPWLGGR